MRYIKKPLKEFSEFEKEPSELEPFELIKEPSAFTNWKKQEQDKIDRWVADDKTSADKIWSHLPSSIQPIEKRLERVCYYSKEELRNTLIKEQGGICCYCGQKLKFDVTTIMEHLEAKSLDKKTTFQYYNIYASCEGGNAIEYTVKKDDEKLGDILDFLRVDVNTVHKLNPDVILQHLKEGEKIKYQILEKHCDAKKDKEIIFIKPNQTDCEQKFGYEPSGEIYATNEDEATKTTICLLGLNDNSRVKSIRAAAWKRGTERLRTLKLLSNSDSQILKSFIEKAYQALDEKDDGGFLSECCFIERFFLRKFLKNL